MFHRCELGLGQGPGIEISIAPLLEGSDCTIHQIQPRYVYLRGAMCLNGFYLRWLQMVFSYEWSPVVMWQKAVQRCNKAKLCLKVKLISAVLD